MLNFLFEIHPYLKSTNRKPIKSWTQFWVDGASKFQFPGEPERDTEVREPRRSAKALVHSKIISQNLILLIF